MAWAGRTNLLPYRAGGPLTLLERTFIHIPGIGAKTERRLWECGIQRWADFIAAAPRGRDAGLPMSPGRAWLAAQQLAECEGCLRSGDHAHFAGALPGPEHWRAYDAFKGKAAYVDIETTGLGGRAHITVIGLYDGLRTRTYIAGENLDEFPEDIAQYSLLVTYNGATFDLPFIQRAFPALRLDQLHVDLRYALARLGLTGGLKAVESRVGLARDERVAGLDGWDAVRLWREYQAGSEESLETLVLYNTADIENLELLMEHAYDGLMARCMHSGAGAR
ncbi:MAG: ribonuclease H-like domain-containing protein [Armatimonadota bacterium]